MSHCRYLLFLLAALLPWSCGCTLLPHKLHEPQYHNPWPQLRKVAVAPFYNLSGEPTLNQDAVAEAYFNELQQIPGFEVVPLGVAKRAMHAYGIRGESAEDFQRLGRLLEVDAVVVGSISDYSPYYPPRLAMSVRWYAANPSFHPIPAGYGLPWGRPEEEFIPDSLVEAAEFELADAQLQTQVPPVPTDVIDSDHAYLSAVQQARTGAARLHAPDAYPDGMQGSGTRANDGDDMPPREDDSGPSLRSPAGSGTQRGAAAQLNAASAPAGAPLAQSRLASQENIAPGEVWETSPAPTEYDVESLAPRAGAPADGDGIAAALPVYGALPEDWPDPRGFFPPPPQAQRPACRPYIGPILSHTRSYNGHDSDFTEALSSYYEFRDEARFGGWQAYLQRSEDFIRFCCYMHITEMLAARGGARETKVVYRWPISRYDR